MLIAKAITRNKLLKLSYDFNLKAHKTHNVPTAISEMNK